LSHYSRNLSCGGTPDRHRGFPRLSPSSSRVRCPMRLPWT
jgi:hypothetical protein